jgi:large subunit ribosomal protein L17
MVNAEVRSAGARRPRPPPHNHSGSAVRTQHRPPWSAHSRCCRTMVSQLLQHERIETTVPRAKELRRLADRVITWGKEVSRHLHAPSCADREEPGASSETKPWRAQGDLHARRKAAAVVRGEGVLQKLFGEMAERYRDREGGYTRILRTRRRANDAAHMAYIECAGPACPQPAVSSCGCSSGQALLHATATLHFAA